jgi:uncharacterized membrane protein YhaH (DUF805 family)
MNPLLLVIGLFDWRGAIGRAAYRRYLTILVLVNVLLRRLDLLHDAAFVVWTAAVWAVALSLNARRYHDMGRSAAWIVWANLIAAAATIVAFQFVPNLLDYLPLPESVRLDSGSHAVIGRFVLPAIVGAYIGNLFQAIWLANAQSCVGPNPYAEATPLFPSTLGRRDSEAADDKAAQAIIDRHLAARRSEASTVSPTAPPSPNAPSSGVSAPRAFGRRRA